MISKYCSNSCLCLLLLLTSCTSNQSIKYDQYVGGGLELYNTHCSNCHGAEGKGLKELYPPINGSDFLTNRLNVICVIKYGAKGPMKVNGKTYNQVMPRNNQLYDLDIAQLTTYIYDKWGKDKKSITETDEVKLANCPSSGQ
jgi:cytochrome c551